MQRPPSQLRLCLPGLLLTLAACPEEGGGSGSGGTGTGTSTGGPVGTSTGQTSGGTGPSDGEACAPAAGNQPGFDCSVHADCCIGAGHPSAQDFPDLACPGTRYPNNVMCIGNQCVNGCNDDDDCVDADLACLTIDTVALCVEPCSIDTDCDDNDEPDPDQRTFCTGENDTQTQSFCEHASS